MTKKLAGLIIFFSLVFVLSLRVISDVDFGWHLRTGEYILDNKKIPAHDLFSYTLPNYPYVYHSWLGEVLVAISYRLLNLTGVSLLFALVSTLTIFFAYKSISIISRGQISYLFLFIITPVAYAIAGGRMRVYNILFLTIINFLFLKFHHQNSKLILLIPLIFAFWTNLHGSFPIGIISLIILSLLTIKNSLTLKEKRSKIKILLLICPCSLLATLINPYSWRAWYQSLSMFSYSYSKLGGINEDWQSIVSADTSNLFLLFSFFLIISLAFIIKSRLLALHIIPLLIFFFLSLVSSRFTIAATVFLIPVINDLLFSIKNKLSDNVQKSPIVRFSLFCLVLIVLLMGAKNLVEVKFAHHSPKEYASYLALEAPTKNQHPAWSYEANLFLENNLTSKRVLNQADWGGFMLLINPEVKLFYYGAMDNYIVDNKSFVFEYLKVTNASPGWENVLKKYAIDTIFLPGYSPLINNLKNTSDWQLVYEDKMATILIKIQ